MTEEALHKYLKSKVGYIFTFKDMKEAKKMFLFILEQNEILKKENVYFKKQINDILTYALETIEDLKESKKWKKRN